MRIYKCAHCAQLVYFENTYCERCGNALGFIQEELNLSTIVPTSNHYFQVYNSTSGQQFKYCANHQYGVCNWLIPASSPDTYCLACELNKTIPDISSRENILLWQKMENAKHRIIYSLLRLHLPILSKDKDAFAGLAFDFLANIQFEDRVLTGHEDGLITINIEEADDLTREQARKQMGEPYRTLLGHFRHETGHYYWDRLIMNNDWQEPFRQMFGNDEFDYPTALENYYAKPLPLNWQQNHISVYASSHPWEDWAETWAHYLHMMDTLETAWSFGLNVRPIDADPASGLAATMDADPYQVKDFNEIVKRWLPFTYAMNSINRSMGQADLYPFVMSLEVIKKLDFIHRLCSASTGVGQRVQYQQQYA